MIILVIYTLKSQYYNKKCFGFSRWAESIDLAHRKKLCDSQTNICLKIQIWRQSVRNLSKIFFTSVFSLSKVTVKPNTHNFARCNRKYTVYWQSLACFFGFVAQERFPSEGLSRKPVNSRVKSPLQLIPFLHWYLNSNTIFYQCRIQVCVRDFKAFISGFDHCA